MSDEVEDLRGTAEANGYVPVVMDRISMIRLLIDLHEAQSRVIEMGAGDDERYLARGVLEVLDESRHLQNEDAWRRLVDVLGEQFSLEEYER